MKIEANDKEIQDIFSLGYFNIPRFQRPYSWEVDEVESFWNDIILEKNESYFIGSMVVFQTQKPYFGIVDGQQRLTTITLILSAIRNSFSKIGEENLAKGVHKYIEKANIENEDEFVLNPETSFPYFQSHIQSFNGYNINCEVGAEEKKLETAYELINHKIRDAIPELNEKVTSQITLFTNAVQALKDFRDRVLALKLVFIQLDNEDDAYLIFETLNARGRDLTTSDLVKNLILKKIKNTSISIDEAKELWNSIVRNLDNYSGSNIIDNFLLHYWVSEFKYCTDKKLFPEIKNHINTSPDSAKKLIKNLDNTAPLYAALLQPDRMEWEKEEVDVKRSLRSLNLFKVKQQTAMTLALIRSYKKGILTLRNLKQALSKIEDFHYCFNAITSQRSSGSIASNYSKLAIMLTKSTSNDEIQVVLRNLKKFLASKLPDREEFIVKFSELEYSSKKTKQKAIVKYTLSKLIPVNNCGLAVDIDRLTIEHIIPEALLKEDPSILVSSIGNLILLDEKTNSEDLADKIPSDKFKILREKNYPLKEALVEQVIWDDKQIKIRAKAIAENIYNNIVSNIV
ncbi:DUF262 domain-containing protein [Acaryochloris marina]|uniref:DUF262 domain-containing protein n=1 Tax=Acaryochloris marina (strain MBIC 11017) TaxID=329726 RepID=B0C567_ACAM1|nr:DUF262 domain-containing protein [Acaryochloris marina]ABW26307.1 conserved hypothetical protein [Acaryochloris marina MBIC11017]BDM81129.1 hypothetical protein AM10699_39960 [Acaryochloris marina MBIC10699]